MNRARVRADASLQPISELIFLVSPCPAKSRRGSYVYMSSGGTDARIIIIVLVLICGDPTALAPWILLAVLLVCGISGVVDGIAPHVPQHCGEYAWSGRSARTSSQPLARGVRWGISTGPRPLVPRHLLGLSMAHSCHRCLCTISNYPQPKARKTAERPCSPSYSV